MTDRPSTSLPNTRLNAPDANPPGAVSLTSLRAARLTSSRVSLSRSPTPRCLSPTPRPQSPRPYARAVSPTVHQSVDSLADIPKMPSVEEDWPTDHSDETLDENIANETSVAEATDLQTAGDPTLLEECLIFSADKPLDFSKVSVLAFNYSVLRILAQQIFYIFLLLYYIILYL